MARKPRAPFVAPALPSPTDKELAQERQISAMLRDLVPKLRQRNLDTAVLLAQQAARGHGPLVDHFQELGRRYAETLDAPVKPKLRVIDGRST